MKKTILIPGLAVIWLFTGCGRSDNLTLDREHVIFERAALNGKSASEGYNRCLSYVHAWLDLADSATGLIPRNINEKVSRDIWNAKDCAADNYPFMVLTAALLDKELFEGTMKYMLRSEINHTSRLGSLPDTYSFSKNGFVRKYLNMNDIIFGSAEYVKDGLMPLTEWLGPSEWSERMISITDDMWKYGLPDKKHGNLISDDPEVNGDMLQSLCRIYWMTGDKKYLDEAVMIGDFYLLGKNHPTRNFKVLRLRDHGCEIVSGLCELYAAVSFRDSSKRKVYREPLYEMLDRILETGRNSDGLFYNSINPVKGIPVNGGIADNFGYSLNGYYTVYMLDGTERYREPVIKALSVLYDKYRNFPWEGSSADGYADAIEGTLNLYTREPVESAERWIDSEIKVMWNKQKKSGLIEGWHGDGNFARTTIMYCLWKSQGTYLVPWRKDLELGAIREDSLLYINISASDSWEGNLKFDIPRHAEYLHLPSDWPRINQFPEYFTVEREKFYHIQTVGDDEGRIVKGSDLRMGYPVKIRKNGTLKIILKIRDS